MKDEGREVKGREDKMKKEERGGKETEMKRDKSGEGCT